MTYNKHLPPPVLGNNSMVEIDMSINVINLGQIDEMKSSIDFQYVTSLSWYEGRRMFQNLQDSRINQLNTREVESLWIPKIVLYNTETRQKTMVDEDAIVSVSRKGNYTELKNMRLFEGTMNPLSLSRFYKTSYICNFDMAWYPFDTQVCSMEFVMVESIRDVGNLTYSGPVEQTQYFIKKQVFSKRRDKQGVKITFVSIFLGRRLLSIILTVFVPTLILNIVGHSSNYFKEFFFEAVISVNVTAMLVLTTMFINVSNNLPKTAYIKMIDVWLLFNLVKPFNDILVTTYIDYLRSDDDRDINHHGTAISVGGDKSPEDHSRNIVQVAPVEVSR